MISRSMSHALKIFGLGLGATEAEVKVRYQQMAQTYHPNMNNHTTGLSPTESSDFFQTP
jgi:DnaJ-class molecular chaperone